MAWLVELSNTDHPAELNFETVCLVSNFSHYVWAIFVETILKILHRKLQVIMCNWNHWAVFYFILTFSSCFNSHVLCYLCYPNTIISHLSICSPCVLHQVLKLDQAWKWHVTLFFEHRWVRNLLANSTLLQESNLDLLPWKTDFQLQGWILSLTVCFSHLIGDRVSYSYRSTRNQDSIIFM